MIKIEGVQFKSNGVVLDPETLPKLYLNLMYITPNGTGANIDLRFYLYKDFVDGQLIEPFITKVDGTEPITVDLMPLIESKGGLFPTTTVEQQNEIMKALEARFPDFQNKCILIEPFPNVN